MTTADTRSVCRLKGSEQGRVLGPVIAWYGATLSDRECQLSLREDLPEIVIMDNNLRATLGSFNWRRSPALVRASEVEFGLPTVSSYHDVLGLPCHLHRNDSIEYGSGWMPNPFMGSGSVLEILLPQPEDAKRLALKALEREFALARDEVFEDGMDSNFARALGSILGNHGKPALAALEQILSRNDVNSEVGAEALIQLGFPRPNLAVNDQVELLCRFLQSRNIRFRDAASLGLASLDDPAAIPELRRAIENEKSDLLKASLQEVLDEMSTG